MRDPSDAVRAAARDARTKDVVIRNDHVYVKKQWGNEPEYEEHVGKATAALLALLRSLGFHL